MHVLLDDDLGRLTVRRLRPWHRWPSAASVARPPQVQLRRDRIARSAAELAGLAGFLAEQGPVPAQGVAMVSQLLADGGGPLYRAGNREDLNALIERASQALIR